MDYAGYWVFNGEKSRTNGEPIELPSTNSIRRWNIKLICYSSAKFKLFETVTFGEKDSIADRAQSKRPSRSTNDQRRIEALHASIPERIYLKY